MPSSVPRLAAKGKAFTSVGRSMDHHIILLAGGPGGYGAGCASLIRYFLIIDIAVYYVEHRGLEGSGLFYEGPNDHLDKLGEITANAPFPLKDLTLHNAALDVGMAALAIRSSSRPDFKLSVYGFSYGANWARQTVAMLPNLFDNMIAGGFGEFAGATHDGLKALCDHCQQDEFCSSKLGPDVEYAINAAVKKIIDPNPNDCVKAMLKLHGVKLDAEHPIAGLSKLLYPLLCDPEFVGNSIKAPQIGLAFLKAAADCAAPISFIDNVLVPLEQYMKAAIVTRSVSLISKKFNYFVNEIVNLDYSPSKGGYDQDSGRKETNRLHAHHLYLDKLNMSFARRLYPWLYDMKLTFQRPVNTSKTKVFIMGSIMDVQTPPMTSWKVFQQTQAPTKHWFLFKNNGHDGYNGPVLNSILGEVIRGVSPDYSSGLQSMDTKIKLDWSMKGVPALEKIWDYVEKSVAAESDISADREATIPRYEEYQSATLLKAETLE